VSASKRRGTAWESAVVDYLRSVGVAHAERRAPAGSRDRGDIAGIPGVVVECKSAARIDLAAWVDETERERLADGADIGVTWIKRRGRSSAGDGYAVVSGATLVRLLAEAGRIPDIPGGPAGGAASGRRPPRRDDDEPSTTAGRLCRRVDYREVGR